MKADPEANTGVTFHKNDGPVNTYLKAYYTEIGAKYGELNNQAFLIAQDRESSPQEVFDNLKAAFDAFLPHIDSFVAQRPSPFSAVIYNDHYSEMYGLFFTSSWNKPVDPSLLEPCLMHQPLMITNGSMLGYYNYLSTFYKIHNDQERYNIFVKVTSKITDDSEITSVIEAYTNKINGFPYDHTAYEKAQSYYEKYQSQFKEARSNLQLKKISQLPPNKASIIKLMSAPEDIQERIEYYQKIIPTTKTKWCKKLMEDQLAHDQLQDQKIKNALQKTLEANGNISLGKSIERYAFGAELYIPTQDSLSDFLQNIRSAFPGKAIILDIWATWCGPCIDDMKNSEEVKSKLKNLGVEVVYLCADSNSSQDKWKYKIAELQTEGTHFFMDKTLNAQFFETFKLGGYPSYIFIDKEGNYDQSLISYISYLDIEALKAKL